MIEFNGYLTGAAEAYFHKRTKAFGRKIIIASLLILFPGILVTGIKMHAKALIWGYCTLFVAIPLLTLIPKSKKERISITPKRIFTEDDCIICVADRYTESSFIADAKTLRDFGEYYEIVFPFGKVSDKFVCQKNLLTKGTLEEFEALFAGKLIRMHK